MSTPRVVVTLFTPFDKSNSVDTGALRECAAFYADAGVHGLFANCQTSETLRLDPSERVQVIRTLVDCCGSGMDLLSGVNDGGDITEQIESIRSVRELGKVLPVIWVSTLPDNQAWDEELLAFAEQVDGPLGIYECPDPVHRLLSDEQLKRVADHGSFVFFKDTCRDNEVFARRMALIRNSALRAYQANWKCLPASLEAGADGFSGWLAAARPDAVVAYCKGELSTEERTELHDALFKLQEAMRAACYPASGKYLLKRRGLSFHATQRNGSDALETVDRDKVALLDAADERVDSLLKTCKTA